MRPEFGSPQSFPQGPPEAHVVLLLCQGANCVVKSLLCGKVTFACDALQKVQNAKEQKSAGKTSFPSGFELQTYHGIAFRLPN